MRMLITIMIILFGVAYAEKFSAGLNVGYGSTSQEYDSTGKAQDFGATFSILNLGLNAKYYILSPEVGPKVYAGVDFKFSQHQFSSSGASVSSGFSPQYLNLLLGGSYVFFNGFVGFQLDLGPQASGDKWPNSDRQNAVLIGLGANVPFMAGAGDFHANVNYALTLEKTEDNVKYDEGDQLALIVGGGYKFGISEVASFSLGLDLIYRLKTEGKVGNTTVSSSSNFSIMPYLKYKTGPISVWAKLGAADEYGYYGFSIMGKNSPVTRLGITAGLNVSY
ncbi:MAG: hypothetical protein RQ990_04410 [Candidatus Hydrothermia bacterium]|nr:hypothetical protein [Candidatus Hydrothermia bacterium]